ncbi:MAG: Lar family restriction alleviation protein [Holdemanella porci]
MPRIKRCPFCHSTAHVVIDWNSKRINGYYGQYVICTLCSKRTKTEPTSDQAIEEWNHHVLKRIYNSLYFKRRWHTCQN